MNDAYISPIDRLVALCTAMRCQADRNPDMGGLAVASLAVSEAQHPHLMIARDAALELVAMIERHLEIRAEDRTCTGCGFPARYHLPPAPIQCLIDSPRFQDMTVADACAELRANGVLPALPCAACGMLSCNCGYSYEDHDACDAAERALLNPPDRE